MISNSNFEPSGPPEYNQTHAHIPRKVNKIPEREEGRREEGKENKSRAAKRGHTMWESSLYEVNNNG